MYTPTHSKTSSGSYQNKFNTKSQSVYSVLQIIVGFGIVTLATLEIVYGLLFRDWITYIEIIGGVIFIFSGIFGIRSAKTKTLLQCILCLILCCFALLCSTTIVLLYPVLLLLDPSVLQTGEGLYWYKVLCLGGGFTFGMLEWIVAVCQILVSYWAVRYMIMRGYEGLSDPRAEHGMMFEASFDPSEETLLLQGRYRATGYEACERLETLPPTTVQTTALITPSAPRFDF